MCFNFTFYFFDEINQKKHVECQKIINQQFKALLS